MRFMQYDLNGLSTECGLLGGWLEGEGQLRPTIPCNGNHDQLAIVHFLFWCERSCVAMREE